MPKQLYKNNASAPLAISAAIGDVTLTVGAGFDGFASPTGGDFQMLTISNGVNTEIVKLMSRAGDAFTVVRAQEGTAAQDWAAGSTTISARLTAGMLGQLVQNLGSDTLSVAISSDSSASPAAASGYADVAVGDGALASGANSAAVGWRAKSLGQHSVALGSQSRAEGRSAVAIGDQAGAHARDSCAIGTTTHNYTRSSWTFHGHPVIQRDDFLFGVGSTAYMTGAEGSFATSFVDLGNVPPWQPGAVYTDGDVVRPTTDNGLQYHLWRDAYSASAIPNTFTSPTTEPGWSMSPEGSVWVESGPDWAAWICVDILNGFTLSVPPNTLFFPTELGFICFKHANVTAAPYVSVGTDASPGLYVNSQQLSAITSALQIQRFAPLINTAVTELKFKLNTKASGTNSQFHGRFYAKGLFIQAQG